MLMVSPLLPSLLPPASTLLNRFTVHPVVSDEANQKSLLSDRLLQSQPSVDLVMCLLDLNFEQALSQGAILRYTHNACDASAHVVTHHTNVHIQPVG